MFRKLQEKWKVSPINLFLIITTFALGGTLCGKVGGYLLSLSPLDKGALWGFFYIILITLLWPLSVILVSIPLGQFSFFKNYLQKVFVKLGGQKKT